MENNRAYDVMAVSSRLELGNTIAYEPNFNAPLLLHGTSQAPAQPESRTVENINQLGNLHDYAAGTSDCITEQSINFHDKSHNKPMMNTAIAVDGHLIDSLFGPPTFQTNKVSYESVPTVVNKLANLIFIYELSLLTLML